MKRRTMERELELIQFQLENLETSHPLFNHLRTAYNEMERTYFEKYGHIPMQVNGKKQRPELKNDVPDGYRTFHEWRKQQGL